MKKIIGYISIALIIGGVLGAIIYDVLCKNNEETEVITMNTTVEELIKQDKTYFDNMAGDIIFYESRVVLPKAFNESDTFVAQEVTNVFQQNTKDSLGNITSNVYEFKHVINYTEVDIQVHKGTFVLEDKPVNTDTLKYTFDSAFQRAKQSDLIPSKSRYIVLRNPLGPIDCNPCYMIGNDSYGLMVVDGVTGNVGEKNPAYKK